MKKKFKLTKGGVDELRAELKQLVAKRPEIAKKIQVARDFGDLSENSEYHAARDDQVALEMRIEEIEKILKSVEIISENQPTTTVSIGNTVELVDGSKAVKYTIVGSVEADPIDGKISNESPIGQALLGKKVGDEVAIELPAGTKSYKIKSII